jgi:hypothetical protein
VPAALGLVVGLVSGSTLATLIALWSGRCLF